MVAANTATFSARMLEAGYADAGKLLPLVFALIVTTVILHGFSSADSHGISVLHRVAPMA